MYSKTGWAYWAEIFRILPWVLKFPPLITTKTIMGSFWIRFCFSLLKYIMTHVYLGHRWEIFGWFAYIFQLSFSLSWRRTWFRVHPVENRFHPPQWLSWQYIIYMQNTSKYLSTDQLTNWIWMLVYLQNKLKTSSNSRDKDNFIIIW